jgi:hypothetical protein
MVDDMRAYLLADPKVAQVEEFSSTVTAPFNEMFHRRTRALYFESS